MFFSILFCWFFSFSLLSDCSSSETYKVVWKWAKKKSGPQYFDSYRESFDLIVIKKLFASNTSVEVCKNEKKRSKKVRRYIIKVRHSFCKFLKIWLCTFWYINRHMLEKKKFSQFLVENFLFTKKIFLSNICRLIYQNVQNLILRNFQNECWSPWPS